MTSAAQRSVPTSNSCTNPVQIAATETGRSIARQIAVAIPSNAKYFSSWTLNRTTVRGAQRLG
jgi:hypothetical protein